MSGDKQGDYDAVIVGASIAGCSVATLLARAGARVALLDRRPDATSYKTLCTHFIQASATETIQRLGLAERIEAAGGLRNGIEAWTREGWIRPRLGADYEHPRYGYDIRREKLDPMLRELASETAGVDLMLGHTVTGLLESESRPAGVRTTDRDRRPRELKARVVVAADGRDSGVGRMARVPSRVKSNDRFVYFAYYRGLPLVSGNRSLLWFLDPDVAYAFPQDEEVTLMACFQTKDRLPWFKRDLEANFENYFRGLPNVPDLAGGERVSKILGKLDMPLSIRPAGRPGLAFVGDAAMAADPVWGVGCGFAFQSGEWLADAIGEALAGGAPDADIDKRIDGYRKRHRRKLLGHFLMMSDYGSGRRQNTAERLMLRAASGDEVTAARFHTFIARSIAPTDSEFARLMGRSLRLAVARRGAGSAQEPEGPHAHGTPLPADVTTGWRTVDGVRVPVSCAGPSDSSEAVVFVHGCPGSRRDWDDLLARCAPIARTLAFDMPGFGRAEKPEGFDCSVRGYGGFLESALDQLEVERVHLVLHDFGGPWGLEWARQNPERLASATLVNTGVLFGYRRHSLARIWETPLLGEAFLAMATRSGLRAVLRRGSRRDLPRAFVDRIYDDLDQGSKRTLLHLYRNTDLSEVGLAQAEALRPLNRPSLVIWGADDRYLPASMAGRQQAAFPSAEVTVLDECGHWPLVEAPDRVGRLVERFLRDQIGV
ncbi:MAG: alpha/beta fold hydrolase [Solirubrobacterales bacterium]